MQAHKSFRNWVNNLDYLFLLMRKTLRYLNSSPVWRQAKYSSFLRVPLLNHSPLLELTVSHLFRMGSSDPCAELAGVSQSGPTGVPKLQGRETFGSFSSKEISVRHVRISTNRERLWSPVCSNCYSFVWMVFSSLINNCPTFNLLQPKITNTLQGTIYIALFIDLRKRLQMSITLI